MRQIRFDDIEALQAEVGGDFGPWSKELLVDMPMIRDFAAMSGDDNWIHVDEEKCRQMSPYGGPIAHGFLLLAVLPRIAAPWPFELVGQTVMVNYGSDRLRFVSVVHAGERVHAHCRLKEVRATRAGTMLNFDTQINVVGKDQPAMVYEMLLHMS